MPPRVWGDATRCDAWRRNGDDDGDRGGGDRGGGDRGSWQGAAAAAAAAAAAQNTEVTKKIANIQRHVNSLKRKQVKKAADGSSEFKFGEQKAEKAPAKGEAAAAPAAGKVRLHRGLHPHLLVALVQPTTTQTGWAAQRLRVFSLPVGVVSPVQGEPPAAAGSASDHEEVFAPPSPSRVPSRGAVSASRGGQGAGQRWRGWLRGGMARGDPLQENASAEGINTAEDYESVKSDWVRSWAGAPS